MKAKKTYSVLLIVTFLMLLSACGGLANNTNKQLSPDMTIKDTGKKIAGDITGASAFSENLAFVCLNGDKEKTYCINKKGNIVFEIDKKLVINGDIFQKFINGYTVVNGAILDTTGKLTNPEEVGATKFYNVAFSGGYILAEKITSDYNSAKKELGVMDMNFKWVLGPSEKLYSALEEGLWQTEALNTKSFYNENIIFFEGCKLYLNIETGEITETSDVKTPSYAWGAFGDSAGRCFFRDSKENTVLDLSDKGKISQISEFVNNKCAVIFENQDSGKYYLTVIDETGAFLFEPTEIKNMPSVTGVVFDGNISVVSGEELRSGDYVELFQSFDLKGKATGMLDAGEYGKNLLNYCDIGDGVILIQSSRNYSSTCHYYNPDFTPLF